MDNKEKYYLKCFDDDLISFNISKDLSIVISDIEIISDNIKIFPIILQKEINAKSIMSFINSRSIPKNRHFVEKIFESLGININDKKALLDISLGLSLNDTYWVVKDKSYKFSNYNLYDNDFSSALSLVAFTGYNTRIKGQSSSPETSTNGMLRKAWRRIDNKVYLYKGGTSGFSNAGFEPYSEFYACQVAKKMGFDYIDYDLHKWKGILASTCKLFTSKEKSYVPMVYMVDDTDIREAYEFCKSYGFADKFSDMILFDAVIINPDRHFNNFGIMRDNHTGNIIDFAPIFDNGMGLLSVASLDAFKDNNSFIEYINREDINTSKYGILYDELVKAFCTKKDIEKLRKLLTFRFAKHQNYNIKKKRLQLLDTMIQSRARHFIDVIENKGV